MPFPALGLTARLPDAKTICPFRDRLIRADAIAARFVRFDLTIRKAGYITVSVQISGASLVSAPKEHYRESEKQNIKAGCVPDDWKNKPAKLRKKDTVARWTARLSNARTRDDGRPQPEIAIPTCRYNALTGINRRYRFIQRWDVIEASRHDGRMLRHWLLDKSSRGSSVRADSAYRSIQNEQLMEKNDFTYNVHNRKPKTEPPLAHIRRSSATRSKHGVPVEHGFAYQKRPMELVIRTIGIIRVKIGMANIAHNMHRLVQISWAGVT